MQDKSAIYGIKTGFGSSGKLAVATADFRNHECPHFPTLSKVIGIVLGTWIPFAELDQRSDTQPVVNQRCDT